MRAGGLACVIAGAFAASIVGAVPADGTFEFQPPASMEGADSGLAFTLSEKAYLAGYGDRHRANGTVSLATPSADLTVVERTVTRYVLPDGTIVDPPGGDEERDESRYALGNATVTIADWQPYHAIVVGIESGITAQTSSATLRQAVTAPVLVSQGPSGRTPQPYGNSSYWPNAIDYAPPGSYYEVQAAFMDARGDGDTFVYAMGSTIRLTNETGDHEIWTGSTFDSRENLVGEGAVVRYRTTAAIIEGGGNVSFNYSSPALFAYAEAMDIREVSNVSLPLATGNLQTDAGSLQFRDRPHVDLDGDMALHFPPLSPSEGGRLTVRVGGDVVAVSQNRLTTTAFEVDPLTAVAGGFGLLVLVAAILSFARKGIVLAWAHFLHYKWLVVTAFFTRIREEDALGHPVRRRIMNLVDGSLAMADMATLKEAVASDLDVSKKSVQRHAQRLHKLRLVQLFFDGTRVHVGRNRGASGDVTAQAGATIMQHATGRAVAMGVVDSPGLTQTNLIDALAAPLDVSPSTIKYWLTKLCGFRVEIPHVERAQSRRGATTEPAKTVEVQLVTRRRDGRFTRYYPTPVLATVVKSYQKGRETFGRNLADALQPSGSTRGFGHDRASESSQS